MALISIYKYGDLYKINWYKSGIYTDTEQKDSKEYYKSELEYMQAFQEFKSDGDYQHIREVYNKYSENNKNEKLQNNISRAKNKILEYGHCNKWDYFCTFTLNKNKQDRYDLKQYHKDFSNWIQNYNKKYDTKLEYILIPEQHKDGGWHEHGLFTGITKDSLSINKYGHLDMEYYKNRFGWVCIEPIRDNTKCVFYITKYINKDLIQRKDDVGAHLYYASKGLKTKENIFQGNLDIDETILNSNMWTNDYIGIQWDKQIPLYIWEQIKEYVTDNSNDFNVDRSYRAIV